MAISWPTETVDRKAMTHRSAIIHTMDIYITLYFNVLSCLNLGVEFSTVYNFYYTRKYANQNGKSVQTVGIISKINKDIVKV